MMIMNTEYTFHEFMLCLCDLPMIVNYNQLELCKAHTPHAHCAIYRSAFVAACMVVSRAYRPHKSLVV